MHHYNLQALEFQSVRDLLLGHLATPLGRTAVEELQPLANAAAANRALRQASQLATCLAAGEQPSLQRVKELRSWLGPFLAGRHMPSTKDLVDLLRLLKATARCKAWLLARTQAVDLQAMGRGFPKVNDIADELGMVIDDAGEVSSTSSVKLAEIREEIEAAQFKVRKAVQRFLADDQVYKHLQNPEPSWRHDRPVFQVRQESQRSVPGILHDRSQSGATLFIEPTVVVEAANLLADAKAAEHREIQVILAHLCKGLRLHAEDIQDALASLVDFDLSLARARLIQLEGYQPPEVTEERRLHLQNARHPLLLGQVDHAEDVVPLSIALGDPFRMLVITGPNTGGKTVVLKTIGLLSLMAASGIPIPAAEGCCVPFFDAVFVDVGDEQGITQNLSTFSSHVGRISQCLGAATQRSLVLLDELGAGTDPEEGGALGYAVLEELERRGVLGVVTTHLGRLKDFAYQHSSTENGAMTFDGENMLPLYHLELGVPGASHALDIASRVGMPQAIVQRALEKLGKRDVAMTEAIERVHAVRRDAQEHLQASARLKKQAQSKERELADRLVHMERRQYWLEEEADAVVDEALKASRQLLAESVAELGNAPKPWGPQAKALLATLAEQSRATSVHRRRKAFLGGLRKGAVVYVPHLERRCTVRKVDKIRELLHIEVGKMRMEIPFEDASWLQPL